jgi:rhamnosyltransferase
MQEVNNKHQQVVSVVIRVRNAVEQLNQCLQNLKQQILPAETRLKIIVVDNESTDGTDIVARCNGATVLTISTERFSWGRALNQGIAATEGDVVLLLSADAYPADKSWICEMLRPFSDPDVAAVYGRQIPYSNAPVDERVRLYKHFGTDRKRFDKDNLGIGPTGKGMIVSNACAAIRRSVWQQIPYDENIEAGEECPWSYNIIQRGYAVIYQPFARVYHSHRDRAFKLAWRHMELLKKNLSLSKKRLTGIRILRWVASFAKRRLLNCMWPNIPLSVRIEGIVCLPLEIIAFAVVGFCPENHSLKPKLKLLFWR